MHGVWELSQEEKEKYIPYIKECIEKLNIEKSGINLTNTPLTPQNMRDIMEQLGYTELSFDSNGWQCDFWIEFEKEGESNITVSGCGATFELYLEKSNYNE